MTVTIKDVAKLAGVSISTVSRVINSSKPVSNEAKQRVIKAIEELDYKPNELARSLVTKKSNLIGVIVTDIGKSYIAQAVRGIEEVGRMYKYDILLSSSYDDINTEMKYIDILKNKQVEGLIIISESFDKRVIEKLEDLKTPYSYLNRYINDSQHIKVSIDYEDTSYKLSNLLVENKYKKPLYIYNSKEENSVEKNKIRGYRKALSSYDLEASTLYIEGKKSKDIYDQGDFIMEKIKEKSIDSLYFCQDELAIGFLNYCYDRGISVPEEIGVVGFGGTDTHDYRPKLTTIMSPFYDIGAVAMRKIVKEIDSQEINQDIIKLPVQIKAGQSIKIR